MALRSIVYSPDNKYLCIGSEDNKIYIYSIADHYTLKHTITSHAAAIDCMDVSINSRYLLSKDTGNALVYTILVTGQCVANLEDMKDETWMLACVPQGYYAKAHWLAQAAELFPTSAAKSNAGLLYATGNQAGTSYIATV
jgi:WD40 repeat protein